MLESRAQLRELALSHLDGCQLRLGRLEDSVSGAAGAKEIADLAQGEAEPLRSSDELEPPQVLGRVLAVSRR